MATFAQGRSSTSARSCCPSRRLLAAEQVAPSPRRDVRTPGYRARFTRGGPEQLVRTCRRISGAPDGGSTPAASAAVIDDGGAGPGSRRPRCGRSPFNPDSPAVAGWRFESPPFSAGLPGTRYGDVAVACAAHSRNVLSFCQDVLGSDNLYSLITNSGGRMRLPGHRHLFMICVGLAAGAAWAMCHIDCSPLTPWRPAARTHSSDRSKVV